MSVEHHPQDTGAAFQGQWSVTEGDMWVSV